MKHLLNRSFLLKDDKTFCKNKSGEFNVIIYNECNKDNIKYKSDESYFSTNFNDRRNLKKYLEIEKKLKKLAEQCSISLGELDLYLWYLETGKVLK